MYLEKINGPEDVKKIKIFGEKIARFYGASNMKVMNYGLKKEFLDRYDVDAVLKDNHLTAEQIVEDVLSIS